jgi:hypothetical protein
VTPRWITLPPPGNEASRAAFLEFAAGLAADCTGEGESYTVDAEDVDLRAATSVLADLAAHGWSVKVAGGRVEVMAPAQDSDAATEKARVQTQELLKRNEQLRVPSVRRFVEAMERPREHGGRFVSIFSVMRDGGELAAELSALNSLPHTDADLRELVDPYVQIVDSAARCPLTGLRLMDIWRYFRHTWSNQYTSTPGRTMAILIRDRAAEFHPVIGIAALGSAIVQINERDDWIGWQPKRFIADLAENPTIQFARWLIRRLEAWPAEIYTEDLLRDKLFWPKLWERPTDTAVNALLTEAEASRRNHHRFVRRADHKRASGSEDWRTRAETDLFRSKRCVALAQLLRTKAALLPHLYPRPTVAGLRRALSDPAGRRAISDILRRAKSGSVGTAIADLTVCGAVAPYNHLLGGKLVSMLAVSPEVVRAYEARYADKPSEIASSLAGRPISRSAQLVYVGTTSLYGANSSQYNRVRIPARTLGAKRDIEFAPLGRSRSFGTSHLSERTVGALVTLTEQSLNGVRVNSIFGEGVNPKLRKVRAAIDLLDWPSDELLRHRRQRLVYGVSLVENLLPYLLGIDPRPTYAWDRRQRGDVDAISAWWMSRWLSARVRREDVLQAVAAHSTGRPVQHGARVTLPTV